MSAHDEGMVQRLGEAERVREHGGALVTASAVLFDQADEANSLMIDRVEVLGDAGRRTGATPSIDIPPQPRTLGAPRIPKVERQSMDAEDFSDAIHTGQGSDVVTDCADHWSSAADNIQLDADRTRRVADSIQEHWADLDANAATKVRATAHGSMLPKTGLTICRHRRATSLLRLKRPSETHPPPSNSKRLSATSASEPSSARRRPLLRTRATKA